MAKLLRAAFVLGFFLMLAGLPAYADPCATTTLADIIGTSCTIGNATYTFSATAAELSDLNTEIPAINIYSDTLFTPDATSIPGAVGFTLESPLFNISTDLGVAEVEFSYTVTLDPDVEPGTVFSAETATISDVVTDTSLPIASALAQLDSGGKTCVQGIGVIVGEPGFSSSESTNLACLSSTQDSLADVAVFGPGFIGSAGFYMDERTLEQIDAGDTGGSPPAPDQYVPSPEPATLSLLGLGLAVLCFWRRWGGLASLQRS